MHLAATHICEHASYHAGRTSMINAFNQVHGSAPASVDRMTLLLVFHFPGKDRGRVLKGRVDILTGDRETHLPSAEFAIKLPDATPPQGLPLQYIQVLNVNGFPFPRHGLYAFEVFVEGIYLGGDQVYFAPVTDQSDAPKGP